LFSAGVRLKGGYGGEDGTETQHEYGTILWKLTVAYHSRNKLSNKLGRHDAMSYEVAAQGLAKQRQMGQETKVRESYMLAYTMNMRC